MRHKLHLCKKGHFLLDMTKQRKCERNKASFKNVTDINHKSQLLKMSILIWQKSGDCTTEPTFFCICRLQRALVNESHLYSRPSRLLFSKHRKIWTSCTQKKWKEMWQERKPKICHCFFFCFCQMCQVACLSWKVSLQVNQQSCTRTS